MAATQGNIILKFPKMAVAPTASFFNARTATLADLKHGLATGAFTSKNIVEEYLSQIQKYNHYLKAVYELAPNVLEQAENLDIERSTGRIRSDLHGIPVLLKVRKPSLCVCRARHADPSRTISQRTQNWVWILPVGHSL